MPEGFYTIDRDYWNVVSVALKKFRVGLNIYLIENVLISTPGGKDGSLRLFAEVASRTCKEHNLSFVHKITVFTRVNFLASQS